MDRLLTVPDVCAYLRLSRGMLYRLIADGSLTPVRFGRAVRFRPDDLAAFVAACQAAPDPDASGPRAGLGWAA